MKTTVFTLVSFFAFASISQSISPITSFTPANYIGQGSYLADDGTAGNYSSLFMLGTDGWNTALFLNGELNFYENVLSIDDNGFFTVTVTDASDPNNPVDYFGFGNCGSMQCQITVDLDNGILQKTMVFADGYDSIYNFGAIYFNDGTPDVQWEETDIILPDSEPAE